MRKQETTFRSGDRRTGVPRLPRRWGGDARGAFTMVEMLVMLALLLVVGSLALVTFQVAANSRRQALARIDVAEKARGSLEAMSQEISAAFLNPVSLIPYPEGQGFPGTFEDIQSIGVDEDRDGLVDEEELSFIGINSFRRNRKGRYIGDDLDNDGDGSGADVVTVGNLLMAKGAVDSNSDGFPDNGIDEEQYNGIDDDGDGMVDEDIILPADMLNLVIPFSTASFDYSFSTDPDAPALGEGPTYDLAEVGYSLYPGQDKLMRRLFTAGADTTIDGRFLINDGGSLREGNETEFAAVSEIFSFDIVGLDFRYYFYDYQVAKAMNAPERFGLSQDDQDKVFQIIQGYGGQTVNDSVPGGRAVMLEVPVPNTGGTIKIVYPYPNSPWAYTEEWRSDRVDVSPGHDGYGAQLNPFYNLNNEPDDAVDPEDWLDSIGDPVALERMFAPRRQETDGLPQVVEVTIFAYDGNRELTLPIEYKTRIYVAHR